MKTIEQISWLDEASLTTLVEEADAIRNQYGSRTDLVGPYLLMAVARLDSILRCLDNIHVALELNLAPSEDGEKDYHPDLCDVCGEDRNVHWSVDCEREDCP